MDNKEEIKMGVLETQVSMSKACKMLGFCRATLLEYEKNGKLKPSSLTPGKHRRYLVSDLLKFMGVDKGEK